MRNNKKKMKKKKLKMINLKCNNRDKGALRNKKLPKGHNSLFKRIW